MSRVKQLQNIDILIQRINDITKNRCSLSEEDLIILNDVTERLNCLRKKKGKTNKDILEEVVPVVKLLADFFLMTNTPDLPTSKTDTH